MGASGGGCDLEGGEGGGGAEIRKTFQTLL